MYCGVERRRGRRGRENGREKEGGGWVAVVVNCK